MGKRPVEVTENDRLVGGFQVKAAGSGAAANFPTDVAPPDAVAHVGVSGIVDSGGTQVLDILEIAFI